jgi:hypothetical protein
LVAPAAAVGLATGEDAVGFEAGAADVAGAAAVVEAGAGAWVVEGAGGAAFEGAVDADG